MKNILFIILIFPLSCLGQLDNMTKNDSLKVLPKYYDGCFGITLIAYGDSSCKYFPLTDRFKPLYISSEKQLPQHIQSKINSIISGLCPDIFVNEIHFNGGRVIDPNKMKIADPNYIDSFTYYDLCYGFKDKNIGFYSFKVYLDSLGNIDKRGGEIKLPDFKADSTKLSFLPKEKIYLSAQKYIQTEDCLVKVVFYKGNIVWRFSKQIKEKKLSGTKTIYISSHNGEKVDETFEKDFSSF